MLEILPAITGLGLVTPLGATVADTWDALLQGRSITAHFRHPEGGADRVLGLALQAARQAMTDAGWADLGDDRIGLVVGTSRGPIESWMQPPCPTSDNVPPAGGLGRVGLGQVAGFLAERLGMGLGPRLTLSAACASGLHALIRAAQMLAWGEARRVLVVAAEASVNPLFTASFHRLGVLPREGGVCRPFDRGREGFLMAEAAAALCIDVNPGYSSVYASIERFAQGGEATHLTGVDPQARTQRRLLATLLQPSSPPDLIHAHGTGTPLNDPIELAALESTLASVRMSPSALYSHKGALGHSVGAAGLIATVLNCQAHVSGWVPPNVQTVCPLETRQVEISARALRRPVRRSWVLASGFGGPAGALSLVSRESKL